MFDTPPPLLFRAAVVISEGLELRCILRIQGDRHASRPGIHARKQFGAWIFGNGCLCRRGFRVGFGIRVRGLCRVRNGLKRSAMLKAARYDKLGAETW